MATVLITGANRGIGLALSRIFKQRGDAVIGVCRHLSAELDDLGTEVIEGIDVTHDASVGKLVQALKGRALDVLINNAGMLRIENLERLDFDGIRRQFEVNTLGPLRVTTALLPFLAQGSKVILITSRMGSIEDNSSGGYYGYRVSKAGLNMAGVCLARDLSDKGIAVGILHPGMVATEMTGRQGIPPEEAARGLVARIDELTLEGTGGFRHADGRTLPW